MKILKKRLLFSRFLPFYVLAIFIFGLQSVAYSQTIISGNVNNSINIISITDPNCGDCNNSEACRYTIEVSDASNFSANDRVLIVQMKGATIDVSNTETGGRITDIGNAGNYEFFIVGAVDAANNYIYPRGKLKRTYDDAGLIQLVKVPSYSGDVEINSDIIGDAWDPATGQGGVVAIFVEGTLTFNADIDVSGRGYQGVQMLVNGTPDDCSIDPLTQMVLPSTSTSGAKKGQGIVIDDNSSNKGRAPRANGGGGGVSGDSGGGGGSNYGAGGAGGNTWCNSSRLAGGLGGVEMATYIDQNRIYFGGAGGSGFVTTDNPSSAANGGGMVIIRAKKIIGNGHTINASGTTPIAVNPTGSPDGGGGGGGGGSVVFEIQEFEGTMDVAVNGGDGQDLNTNIHHGPGGGGGGGAFLYNLSSLPAGINVIANGGAGGVHSDGATNGSQDGSAGGVVSYFNLVYSEEDADNDNISDFCDLDTDNDGILDADEDGGTGFDPSKDADGDNIPNYKDASDATPGFPVFVDTNGDGVNDIYDKDKDHIPDFKDLDSDNDGFVDAVEAGGVADASGVLSNYTDTDLDGLNDTVDPDNGGTPLTLPDYDGDNIPDFLDIDSDDDGISDAYESSTSTIATGNDDDNDGIDNAFDPDLSGVYNALIDRDGDSHYDMFDIDSDNDGITDYYESSGIAPTGNDTDKDGVDDAYDVDFTAGTDVDGDWIDDNSKPKDTDSDSRFDIHDLDSDADGIIDNIEGQTTTGYIAPSGNDTDNDGLDDAYDGNNSGATIIPTDTDGDLTADFLDTNSDNDPDSDLVEAYDSDNDGVSNILPSGTDTDNDGLDDNYDAVSGFNPTDGGKLATDYPDLDDPGDDRDWRQNVPTVTLTLDKGIIAENVQTATFTATLNATTFNDVTINLVYSGSANGSNVDYNSAAGTNATSATTIVIPAGQLSGTVTVTSVDDASVESAETVVVDILSVTNAKEDGVQQKTTTISDNDAPGISVSAISNNTNENGQTATFTIVLNSAPSNDVTINLTSDNLSEGTLSASSIVFTSGNWNTAQEITVTPVDDPVYEPDISFNIITSAASSVDLDYDGMAVDDVAVINEDDDSEPTVNLSINNATINESTAGTATVTATLSNPSTQPATVNITYGGTATATDDYTTNAAVINIAAGATTGTVVITAVNDDIYESGANETVTATLGTLTNCSAGTTTSVGTAIVDDEPIPVVAFNAISSSGLESVSSKDLQVDLSGKNSLAVTVDYVVTGTATGSGTDYTLANGTLTIPAGSTSKNITIASIVEDALDETDETVIVTLSNPANASLGTNKVHTYTITDNDNAPTVAFNATSSSGLESVSSKDLQVDLSAASGLAVTVNYVVTGTATGSGTDYTLANGTLTIPAGSTSKNITIASIVEDALDETDETVIVTLSNPSNASLGTNKVHTYTITDNDNAPIVAFNATSSSGLESVSSKDLKVDLSSASGLAVTVDYKVTGTATGSGTDYTLANGTLTIPAGSTSKNITIASIVDDALDETNETVIVTLSNPSNASLGTNQVHTYTITDNDNAPTVADKTLTIWENVTNSSAIHNLSDENTTDDTDPDGDNITYSITAGNDNNIFAINSNTGVISIADNSKWSDVTGYSLTILASDGNGNSDNATVDVTVLHFPDVINDTESITENNSSINSSQSLLTNDNDVDGETLTVSEIDGITDAGTDVVGDYGTLNWSTDGTFVYTLNNSNADVNELQNGDSLEDIFTYTANDGNSGTTTAKLTITINGANDAPVSADNSVSTKINTIKVFAQSDFPYSDPEGDALTQIKITTLEGAGSLFLDTDDNGVNNSEDVTAGQVILVSDIAKLKFEPALNASGVPYTTFKFMVYDGTAFSVASNTMTINVSENTAPTSADKLVSTNEDVDYLFGGTEFNFTDADVAAALDHIQITALPAKGTLYLDANDNNSYDDGEAITVNSTIATADLAIIGYLPAENENGSPYSTFQFKVNDGIDYSVLAYTVTINVTATNDNPAAVNDSESITENTVSKTSAVALLTNDSDVDGDAITVSEVEGEVNADTDVIGSYGTLNWSTDGTYVYTLDNSNSTVDALNVGDDVTDSFNYTISDGNGGTSSAQLIVTISGANDAPVADDDADSVNESEAVSINLTDGDTDVDGTIDVATVELGSATNGTLIYNGDGTVTYTHDGSENFTDEFTYTVKDNDGLVSNTATVSITISPVNDAPVSADNSVSTKINTIKVFAQSDFPYSDPEGDALTQIKITTLEGAGSLFLDADDNGVNNSEDVTADQVISVSDIAKLKFEPALNASGVPYTTFKFMVYDGTAYSVASNTMTINVSDNTAPTSADKLVSTNEDVDYLFDGTEFNFTDVDVADALNHIQITALPAKGTLYLDANDNNSYDDGEAITVNSTIATADLAIIGYLPAENENGSPYSTFQFKVNDGIDYSVLAYTVTINVTAINDTPATVDDAESINEGDVSVSQTNLLVDNDSDVDGDNLSVSRIGDKTDAADDVTGTYGTLNWDTDGSFVYTLDNTNSVINALGVGQSIVDQFTYYVSDGNGGTATGLLTVTINGVNDNPAAVDDSESITENTVSKTSTVALLNNDSDVEGDAITVSAVEGETDADTDVVGSYGTLNWSTDGTYVYTLDNSNSTVNALNVGDNITDSFNYTISDGNGGTSSAQLIVTISGANDAPVADVETVTVPEGDAVTINLADGDTDADGTIDLGSMVMSSTSHGTLVDNGDGTVTYTHDGSETNSDSFTYTIKDNDGAVSNEVTVDITVTAVNDAPVARNDVATMNEGTVLNGNSLLANDSDPDGDNLVINTQPVSGPSHGTVTINSDGTYVYNPEDGYVGGDAFVYEVCDTNGACTQATVSITISMTDVNESPIAVDDDFETVVDGIISGNVLTNDLDPDGDELQVTTTPLIDVTHGVLTLFADGTFEYIPNEGWYGDDTFTYQVCDTKDMCSMADVTITVNIGDVDGDRIPDSDEGSDTLVDTDGDGTPDYRDVDSDNDGVSDADEIYGDCDGDGILNRLDADNCDFSLHIPKGFSPNGDGVNDGFVIPDIQIFSHVSIEVFNRWGTIIFKDDHFESNTTGWAGTSNVDFSLGKELPTGTYFYIVKIYDTNETKSGYIYLNR